MEQIMYRNNTAMGMATYGGQGKRVGQSRLVGRLSAIGENNLKKFYICYFDLGDVARGDSRQGGKRPCIIVSNNMNNKHCSMLTVIPLTTRKNKKNLPTHCEIMVGNRYSIALGEQIMIVPKSSICINNPIGGANYVFEVEEQYRESINKILRVQLAL